MFAAVGDARSHLAAIVDSADDAIVSKSLDGVILSWNRGAERMFGWTAAEAVGRHITLIIPEERHTEEHDILARIRRGEGLDHFETVRVTRDGRRLNISLSVSPVRDSAGRIVGASKVARDVTERRRLEDARDRLLIEAEALNRAKDHLLATVSHELRTPLNSILGYARLLENGTLDEAARRHAVRVLTRSAMTQGQLIDDLLDLSLVVTGRMQLAPEKCELRTVIDGALDVVRPAADAKRIAVVTAFAPDVGPILGAPDRLRQVVWNLAINAIKFTPAGGRIDVTLRRSGTHVEVLVADNGVGISREALPHVFELFRQEDSSSTRKHGGLGLGLALVKSLVELHGGYVKAESAGKGKGACFTVALPLALPGEYRESSSSSASGPLPRGLVGVKVLVVDDDEGSLDYFAMALQGAGAVVTTASTAVEAVRIVQEQRVDVVLSDIAMPGQDGYWLVHEIQKLPDPAARSVPVVATTAYGRTHSREKALAAGFVDHLPKPAEPGLLYASIARAAGR